LLSSPRSVRSGDSGRSRLRRRGAPCLLVRSVLRHQTLTMRRSRRRMMMRSYRSASLKGVLGTPSWRLLLLCCQIGPLPVDSVRWSIPMVLELRGRRDGQMVEAVL
jgi:hypothetical protein